MKSKFSSIFPFFIHTETSYPKVKRKLTLKRILILFPVFIFLTSCDDIPNEVVDQGQVLNKVLDISAPSTFTYSQTDSLLTVAIQFEDVNTISNVWVKISSIDGELMITDESGLFDNGNLQQNGDQVSGDDIYSNKIPVSKTYSNGNYIIDFFAEDNIRQSPNNVSKVGSHIFSFNNNQISYAPVISDLSIPSSANRGDAFTFSVKASDQNGLTDVEQVYFKLYRPDDSLVDPQNGLEYFLMVDNGDTNLGDQTANDGIFSFKNSFGTSAQTGTWKFEFQAKDRNGLLSNTIIHNMSVN